MDERNIGYWGMGPLWSQAPVQGGHRRPAAGDKGMNKVWLFDLDDTLHDATRASMPHIRDAMGDYIQRHLGLSRPEAEALRNQHWHRYGATLLGLVRHQGVDAAHFLHHTHVLPGLEARVRGHRADIAALQRLPGRKVILTNAPAAYALRVLGALGIRRLFDHVVAIEDMQMFGHLRPKPDARMLRALAARLQVHPSCCVLVEDTLVHQKSARRVGMATVWMQRWRPPRGRDRHRRPAYVVQRVRKLKDLR
jgi:putative hydrolase of the HAD superfamily